MAIHTKHEMIISSDIKKLRKALNYEKVILKIMNDSKKIFDGKYERNAIQDNGEADFFNIDTKEKYEAKLMFSKEVCIGISKGNYIKWMQEIGGIINESTDAYLNGTDHKSTQLYIEIEKRLKSINNDENGILFLPFPYGQESNLSYVQNYILPIFARMVIEAMGNCEFNKDKNCYLIYGNQFNEVVIRDLRNNVYEIIEGDYISYFIDNRIVEFDVSNN